MVETYCTPIPDLEPVFWIAVLLSFTVIGFLYALGRFVGRREFEGMAKSELNQTVIAIVIALAIVGFAGLGCEAAKTLIGGMAGEEYNQFTYSYEYLNKLTTEGRNAIVEFWAIGFVAKSMNFDKFGKTWGNPFVIVTIWTDVLSRLSGIIFGPMIGSLQLQLLFLQMSQAFAMTIILPMGMVLRAIPMTRKGGSFLLALAFGLYLVLPLIYSINYEATKFVWEDLIDKMAEQREEIGYGVWPLIKNFFNSFFTPFDKMALIIPQAIPLAIINLTITLGFVNVFANFLDEIK